MTYSTLHITLEKGVAWVEVARAEKANALDEQFWQELPACMYQLDQDAACRVVVLAGQGKHFCAGIDLGYLMKVGGAPQQGACEGRRREALRKMVLDLQNAITSVERCAKPVIAAIHGGCIGAGVDLVTACDMRFATDDAFLQVKEIDMGMVADLGTLQRLPKIISAGLANEICYTGRKVMGQEAASIGLVNRSYPSQEELYQEVAAVAASIASKSPLSIRGTKEMLLYSRDHSVEEGLRYIATWNAAMLLSDDLNQAFQAAMTKQAAMFQD